MGMDQSPTEWLTVERAAAELPFGNADWVREQLRLGKLIGSKIGGRWVVQRQALWDMLEAGSNSQRRRRRRRIA